MLGENSAKLVTTPDEPPFPSSQTFQIEGKLKEDGSFEANVQDTSRGDQEYLVRAAFRRVPQPQWKDLVQQISYALGFAGTVSDISASVPDVVSEPFHFSYTYNRKDYPEWSKNHFTVPGLPFYMPPVRDDSKDPVWLGVTLETVSDAKVEIPKGYLPELPSAVDLKYDFAEYHATYSQNQGVLSARRRLVIKLHEVPASELDDYRSFVKNLQNDVNQYVETSPSNPVGGNASSRPSNLAAALAAVRKLPDSISAEANQLETDAAASMQHSNAPAAETGFKRAVDIDPKFTRAWIELANVRLIQRQPDAALDAMRKAIDSNPKELVPRKLYAYGLITNHRPDAALSVWREVLLLAPEDSDAISSTSVLLLEAKRYAEALPYLERVAKADTSTHTQIRLGSVYLKVGQAEKGTALLDNVLAGNPKPDTFNDVAYEMAEAETNLSKALEYAQRAVDEQEKQSYDVSLSALLPGDLACTQKIGSFWDTLGWVEFRLGHYDRAESYLRAAWVLTQFAVVGDHLGQVYEKENKPEQAIHMYRLAIAVTESGGVSKDAIRERLAHLGVKPSSNPMDAFRDRSGDELSHLRSVKLKRLVPGSATAEFFLLFSPGPTLKDASFISGDKKLKSAGAALTASNFQVPFPTGSSAHLVRRAIVMCSPVSGCEAVLYTPGSVHSVE